MTGSAWSPAGSDSDYRYDLALLFVFWPEPQYHAVIARWPQLTEHLGATWDEQRQRTERQCAMAERDGIAANYILADAADFEAFLAGRGVTTPGEDDLRAYPDKPDATAAMVSWPPARTDPCWCESGRKYKQCCRPYGIGTLEP